MNFINPFSFPDPVTYAVFIFISMVIIEIWIITKQLKHTYNYHEAWASINMGLGVVLVNLACKTFYISLFFILYKYRIFNFLGPVTFQGFFDFAWHIAHWYAWVLLFFADDFTFYWCHRCMHEVRLLWAGHVNHHSSQEYNFATALRQGWWEYIFKYVFWIWLALIGFHPIMIFFMMQFSLIYQFFIHTELEGVS